MRTESKGRKQLRSGFKATVLLAVFALLWAGCGAPRVAFRDTTQEQTLTIVVLDFENVTRTRARALGRLLADKLSFEFFCRSRGRYDLLDRAWITAVREDVELDTLSPEEKRALWESLGVDIVVKGKIVEYRKGDIEEKAMRLGLLVELVSTEDGKIIGMAGHTAEGEELQQLVGSLTNDLAARVVGSLEKYQRDLEKLEEVEE